MSHALPRPYNDKFTLGTLTLSPIQSEIVRSRARMKVVSAGRRAGKTYSSAGVALQIASEVPGAKVVIMAPTIDQVKKLYAKLLSNLIPPALLVNYHKSERIFYLTNGSTIELYGSEAYERIRGLSITYIILDEVSTFSCTLDDLFAVIRPALSDQRKTVDHPLAGGLLAISTPDGTKGMFHDLWELGGKEGNEDGWARFQFTTLDGGNVPFDEVVAAKADMDAAKFRAEYLADFNSGDAHRVIHAYERAQHVSELAEDDGISPLTIGLDFNVGELCAVVARRIGRHRTSRGGLLVFDCISLVNSHTQAMADEISARFPGRKITICPDASGNQQKTSAGGNTDHAILRAAGFTVDSPAANPQIKDRVNNVNWAFRAADGTGRVLIHPRAERLLHCVESQIYVRKPSGWVPSKGEGGDDYSGMNDALGYLITRSLPMPDPAKRAGTARVMGVG